jgi:hypothetical protein
MNIWPWSEIKKLKARIKQLEADLIREKSNRIDTFYQVSKNVTLDEKFVNKLHLACVEKMKDIFNERLLREIYHGIKNRKASAATISYASRMYDSPTVDIVEVKIPEHNIRFYYYNDEFYTY